MAWHLTGGRSLHGLFSYISVAKPQLLNLLVTSGLVAFCIEPYGACPFLTGLVPALILTVGGHDRRVYQAKIGISSSE